MIPRGRLAVWLYTAPRIKRLMAAMRYLPGHLKKVRFLPGPSSASVPAALQSSLRANGLRNALLPDQSGEGQSSASLRMIRRVGQKPVRSCQMIHKGGAYADQATRCAPQPARCMDEKRQHGFVCAMVCVVIA